MKASDKTARKNGIVLEIYQDEDAESPRKWNNLGVMVCFHSRYDLGDKGHGFYSPDEFREWLETDEGKRAVVLPLYLYDHSGLTIRTTMFSCPWDSGQVGWIYVTEEKAKEEWSDLTGEDLRKRAERVLMGEVEIYDQYLQGDVWGYVLREVCPTCKQPDREIDSRLGFYGLGKDNGMIDNAGEEYRGLFEEVLE